MLVLLLAAFSACTQDGGSFSAKAAFKDLLRFQLPACFKPVGKFTCVAHNESSRFTRLQVVVMLESELLLYTVQMRIRSLTTQSQCCAFM